MRRTKTALFFGLLGLMLFVSMGRVSAQETQPVASANPQTTVQASPADAAQATTEPKKIDQTSDDKKAVPSAKASQTAGVAAPAAKGKKGEQVYTGPTTVVELPPDTDAGRRRKATAGSGWQADVEPAGEAAARQEGTPAVRPERPAGDADGEQSWIRREREKAAPGERKPPKTVAVSISHGILTVDGLTGKAALNYEIKDLKYIYFYVPGIGTTVVSNDPFPGAVEQKHAFDDKTLTVTVGEHVVQLSSDNRLLGKTPESAFVLVDKYFTVPTKFPVMGYGPIRVAPYAWPGSKVNQDAKGVVEAPPLPADLRPTLLLQPCPAGQMRPAGPAVLPGQTAEPKPCVPIRTATNVNGASPTGNVQTQK